MPIGLIICVGWETLVTIVESASMIKGLLCYSFRHNDLKIACHINMEKIEEALRQHDKTFTSRKSRKRPWLQTKSTNR
jgi:hypothetical protein